MVSECFATRHGAGNTANSVCAEFGINKEVRHASYIANWIELLRADDRAFFTAASQAQKAADYLRGLALTESLPETVA